MIKETLSGALYELWPMLFIFTVILSSVRITYLIVKRHKFVLYREFFSLLFIIYILILFYIVSFQDLNYGTSNYVPFTEMFRYSFWSRLFIKNVVGNLLLFIPFGLFISYYLKNYSIYPVIILSFITSLSIEVTQLMIGRVFDIDDIILNIFGAIIGYMMFIAIDAIAKRMPKFIRNEWVMNLIVFIVIIILVLYFFNLEGLIFSNFL
jgi:glycopeptide antibiotics resistance protein